jgi:uncharacterized membrane protein YdbT with pleckstrin-like domain
MGSRERKRAARQKRKQRGLARQAEIAERQEKMEARSEARNQEAREKLEPLEPDERPLVVTVGAVISAAIAVFTIVGYLAGVEVTQVGSDGIAQGEGEAPLFSVIVVVVLMGVMAWGMWRARYWAVLGFQALLALVIVAGCLGLVGASEAAQAIATTALVAAAGTMFYFMVKAMARIQMPERRRPGE